jgi:hypothetical protein
MLFLTLLIVAIAIGVHLYRNSSHEEPAPRPALTEDHIKQQWRKLGFYCELDTEKRTWTLIGSRAGLLYFPDLLLGFAIDPKHATNGHKEHYGPYGSLEIMMHEEPGFDSHAIRGSQVELSRLASLVEEKLASAEPGETLKIREDYSSHSPYTLVLDVRADGFDPASADGASLGVPIQPKAPAKPKLAEAVPAAE